MADRLTQYSMASNFAPGMIPQQQQQPGLQQDSIPGFPEQNPLWPQMQQMQQIRPQADMNRNQMAELLRARSQNQQQQFGLGMTQIGGASVPGQQQPFLDQPNQNQPHMPHGFSNIPGQNPSFQQSMHNRNNMLQALQNTQARQLELIGMAQNQQNQNGPINLGNRVGQQQGAPNAPPSMNQPSQNDMFSSPAMNPNEALRRPSPAHQIAPPNPSQQSNQPGMPMRPAPSRSDAIQERAQSIRGQIAAIDMAIQQLQASRSSMNEPHFSARMKQLYNNKVVHTETLQRLMAAVNSINMSSNFNPSNGGQANSWMQPPFGPGASQTPNHIQSQPNIQSSPSQPHPQPSNPMGQNNVPPRPGPPLQQQPGAPFHNQMVPQFPFNPMNNQQNPPSGAGAGNVPNSNQGPTVPMLTFNIPPLEKNRFEASFKSWCQTRSVSIDQRALSIDGRPIDLYSLHCNVIREGGLGNVQAKDLWAVIGARLGFVQFPGNGNDEPPKSGPAVAQRLGHVYKEYLSSFDAMYIGSLENRRRAQQQQLNNLRANAGAPPGGPSGFLGKNWTPSQSHIILSCADKSVEQLRAQRVPENVIQFVEHHRARLQQMISDQSNFRGIIRPNSGQNPQFDANNMNRQLGSSQFPGPQQGGPSVAHQFPPGGPFVLKGNEQPPPNLNGAGPPRINREHLEAAHANINKIKADITQRVLPMMQNVDLAAEHRLEYNELLERVNRLAVEFEAKLPIYYAMTKNEENIRKLIHCVVVVQQQRTMLSWSSPRVILGLDMLRQYNTQIAAVSEQLNVGLTKNFIFGVNSGAPPNPMPPRPPQIPPQSSPLQQVSTPAQTPSVVRPPPPVTLQPPTRKKQLQPSGPSPKAPATPTPPPAVSVTTPVSTALTPAASPQTPKSPKTKVKPKPTKQRRLSVKGSNISTEPAQGVTVGTKRPLENDTASPSMSAPTAGGAAPSSSSSAPNEPSPPKRAKTEWDEPVSEDLKKKTEAVENIKTEEDASQFFEQTMTELVKMTGDEGEASSLTSDISSTLDMILKNFSGIPDSGTSGDLSSLSVDNAAPASALSTNDEFGQYFDFSSFVALEDDDSESKANTPDLISSSSTNLSPESGSEADPSHHASLLDSKLDDFSDPLRLGTLKEIDGGESAYYQSSEWKWDGSMTTVEQPWLIFNS